jgi:hypothetical protein
MKTLLILSLALSTLAFAQQPSRTLMTSTPYGDVMIKVYASEGHISAVRLELEPESQSEDLLIPALIEKIEGLPMSDEVAKEELLVFLDEMLSGEDVEPVRSTRPAPSRGRFNLEAKKFTNAVMQSVGYVRKLDRKGNATVEVEYNFALKRRASGIRASGLQLILNFKF